jgi:hypothetical protein
MFDAESLARVRTAIRDQTKTDAPLLEALRADIRTLKPDVQTIRARSTTAVSLVASDGGNNKLAFDPFLVQLVRVVDSYGKEAFFGAISPTTDPDLLSAAQFAADGTPSSAVGRLIADLGLASLGQLSPMIPRGSVVRDTPADVSRGWPVWYRDICEWAVLYDRICHHNFATDTLIVRDGLLRAKIFNGALFVTMGNLMETAIDRIAVEDRRHVFLVGLAKHSQVLARYRLAIALEGLFPPGEPRFVEIPREIEAKVYRWSEYARGPEAAGVGEEAKFVIGKMYFARFGTRTSDPIWAIDLFVPQRAAAQEVFGYLLADAIDGFPVPYYPRCLQRAHEHAQVVDFDLEILQNEVMGAIRENLSRDDQDVVDAMRLAPDVAARRYE